MRNSRFEARIRRARELASAHGFASEGLRFYESLLGFQALLYSEFHDAGLSNVSGASGAFKHGLDATILLPRFAPFLSLIEKIAPRPLSQSAHELARQGAGRWQEMLPRFWESGLGSSSDLEPAEILLSWTFLQPYAEYLAGRASEAPVGTPRICPLCGAKPQAGTLRREGDGARRSLICALCGLEWNYRRMLCAACGEEDVQKLAVYTAEEFPHVRVEACDACHFYIKTVDLTKDGRAVPVVDELATLPLDLWAAEHGYRKLQTNILGI